MKNISVEEYDKLVTPSKEILDKVMKLVENRDESEDDVVEKGLLDFKLGDNVYEFLYLGEESIDDCGKYQYGASNYQLTEGENKFNLFIRSRFSRSGSYFTDYYYSYDKPEVYIAEIKEIPEVVIPAHKKCEFKIVE